MAIESQALTFENTKAVLTEFAQAVVDAYKEGVTKYNAIATHKLLDKVTVGNINTDDGHFTVTINLMEYWKYVEAGREAGKLPPIDAIEEWVKARRDLFGAGATQRGVPSYASLTPTLGESGAVTDTRSIAWAVATNIKKNGIKARPILAPSVKESINLFRVRIAEAVAKDFTGALAMTAGSIFSDVELKKVNGKWEGITVTDTLYL